MESIGLTVPTIAGLSLSAALIVASLLAWFFLRRYYLNRNTKPVNHYRDLPISQWDMSKEERAADNKEEARWSFVFPVLTVIVLAVIWSLALIPYNVKYQQSYVTTGTVLSVSDQFVAGTGDASYGERLVTMDSTQHPVIVQNPRILSYKPGDTLSLTCQVSWNYRNADKWTCDIREVK